MKKIPKSILSPAGDEIPIIQEDLEDGLGYWDPKLLEIHINKNQPEVGKWITLIHEFMHMVDDYNKSDGVIKRRWQI